MGDYKPDPNPFGGPVSSFDNPHLSEYDKSGRLTQHGEFELQQRREIYESNNRRNAGSPSFAPGLRRGFDAPSVAEPTPAWVKAVALLFLAVFTDHFFYPQWLPIEALGWMFVIAVVVFIGALVFGILSLLVRLWWVVLIVACLYFYFHPSLPSFTASPTKVSAQPAPSSSRRAPKAKPVRRAAKPAPSTAAAQTEETASAVRQPETVSGPLPSDGSQP